MAIRTAMNAPKVSRISLIVSIMNGGAISFSYSTRPTSTNPNRMSRAISTERKCTAIWMTERSHWIKGCFVLDRSTAAYVPLISDYGTVLIGSNRAFYPEHFDLKLTIKSGELVQMKILRCHSTKM